MGWYINWQERANRTTGTPGESAGLIRHARARDEPRLVLEAPVRVLREASAAGDGRLTDFNDRL